MPLLCTTKIQKERAMSIFGVYALICTLLLLVYYMVTIWFDLHGSKGSRKEETETISTGDMVDTETSTAVRELDGGGYQLSSTEYEEEPVEEPVLVEPSGESERALRIMELNGGDEASVFKEAPSNFLIPIYSINTSDLKTVPEKELKTRGVNPGDFITIPEELRRRIATSSDVSEMLQEVFHNRS